MVKIGLKRAYENPEDCDGRRILVDRVWPRGVSKERLNLDSWLREIAPTSELRRWFGHDLQKWEEFKRRYFSELADRQELVDELLNKVAQGRVTLVFAARDVKHNNAVALMEYLANSLKG